MLSNARADSSGPSYSFPEIPSCVLISPTKISLSKKALKYRRAIFSCKSRYCGGPKILAKYECVNPVVDGGAFTHNSTGRKHI